MNLSTPEASIIAALIVGIVSLVTALIAQRQNRAGARATEVLQKSANELDERKVDLDYFKEYRDSMDERLRRLEADVKEEREARMVAEKRADEAEQRAKEAERRAVRLERRVAQLEDVLRDHNIVVPPYDDADLPPDVPRDDPDDNTDGLLPDI